MDGFVPGKLTLSGHLRCTSWIPLLSEIISNDPRFATLIAPPDQTSRTYPGEVCAWGKSAQEPQSSVGRNDWAPSCPVSVVRRWWNLMPGDARTFPVIMQQMQSSQNVITFTLSS
ncbi:hypothetical protein Tco_0513347 [Tanacetum coccineum]